jgi:hypothetical protein
MCFHFVLFDVPSPSPSLSQTLRTLPLEQSRHRPVSTSHCWATWEPGNIANRRRLLLSCCETFIYWWSALAASQTRDWTTLADPCLLLSFFMLLCPVQPRRILLATACLVLSCFALH